MEDKRISEKESLELIAQMIKDTQENIARYAAYPFLIWGYTTVGISIAIWYLYLQTGSHQVNYLWPALPLIAGPLTWYFSGKNKRKGVKNYVDRITNQIWIVLGLVGMTLSALSFMIRIDILFIIPLLMGMGTTLSGCVTRYRPLIIAGTIGTALSFSILFIQGTDKLLAFAAIFIVMMVIPGHILNKRMKQCLKN